MSVDDAIVAGMYRLSPVGDSHLRRALGPDGIPVVAVSDYLSALPDTFARFIDALLEVPARDDHGLGAMPTQRTTRTPHLVA